MKNKVLILIVILVGVFSVKPIYRYFFDKKVVSNNEIRQVAPLPVSGWRMIVNTDEFEIGDKVNVKEVEMAEDGYIKVEKESGGQRITLGKSDALSKGVSKNINVRLDKSLVDGDVIVVSLVDSLGKEVLDDNGNVIEIVAPVGMVMGHYENEY